MNSDATQTQDSLSGLLTNIQPKLALFGHQINNPDAKCSTRINTNYELIYVLDGTGIVTVDDKKYTLHAGDWCFIPAFVPNNIDTPANDPHNNYWMHFDMEESVFTKNLVEALCTAFNGHMWHMGYEPEFVHLYEQLEQENLMEISGSRMMQQAYFEIILLKLCRACKLKQFLTADPAPYNEVLRKMLQFMQLSYKRIHTVGEIAAEVHISESYCTRLCREYLGTSPAKYIMQLKMKEAGRLLHETEKSIQEISEILGFSSEYHFSNTFRRHFTTSPGSYRKQKIHL